MKASFPSACYKSDSVTVLWSAKEWAAPKKGRIFLILQCYSVTSIENGPRGRSGRWMSRLPTAEGQRKWRGNGNVGGCSEGGNKPKQFSCICSSSRREEPDLQKRWKQKLPSLSCLSLQSYEGLRIVKIKTKPQKEEEGCCITLQDFRKELDV